MPFNANGLFEYGKLIQRYEKAESQLIMLTGCNLDTLLTKLYAGYTLEPPKFQTLTMAELAEAEMEEAE